VQTSLAIVCLVVAGLDLALAESFNNVLPPERIPAKVRSAGLNPATLPERIGSTYAMRAVDRRGRMFRIVAAADTGEILAVRPAERRTQRKHLRITENVAATRAAKTRSSRLASAAQMHTFSLARRDPSPVHPRAVPILAQKSFDEPAGQPAGDNANNKNNKDEVKAGLILTLGRLVTKSSGARQVFSLENKTSTSYSAVGIECGFYAGDRLVGNGYASVENLTPGSLAHDDAVALHASDADNVKCRIKPRVEILRATGVVDGPIWSAAP
jgi:hypothetical protein